MSNNANALYTAIQLTIYLMIYIPMMNLSNSKERLV